MTTMDEILARAVERGEVAGVVALATDGRETLYEGAFGRRSLADDDGPVMSVDTVFWVASMTKAVTSLAAMQLVEAGRLDLDAPIGNVMPELAGPKVLTGFDEAGGPKLRPAKRPITLRHLLTHTAGFSYDIWNATTGRYMAHAGIPGIISCENKALQIPLAFDPDERWEYGINIDWVGKTVEKVSGQTLEAYFKERIFDPLGMSDTGFVIGRDQRSRLAGMHARTPDGELQPIPFELPQAPEFFMGGGGLYSTGRDYLRFISMLMNEGSLDGARVLKAETVREMTKNQIGELTVEAMRTAIPEHSNDVEIFPGMTKKFGLGFLINTEAAPTGRSTGSLMWAGLANTYYWIDPNERLGGVVLAQVLPFADPAVLALFAAFESEVYRSRTTR